MKIIKEHYIHNKLLKSYFPDDKTASSLFDEIKYISS